MLSYHMKDRILFKETCFYSSSPAKLRTRAQYDTICHQLVALQGSPPDSMQAQSALVPLPLPKSTGNPWHLVLKTCDTGNLTVCHLMYTKAH